MAVRMLAPVANPSSTRMTVLPVRSRGAESPSIDALPALQFDLFPGHDSVDIRLVQSGRLHHIGIEDPHSPARDGPESQFLLPRNPQLSDHVHIERGVESLRDLEGHHHSSPGKSQHDEIASAHISGEALCKNPPCICAVGEYAHDPILRVPLARQPYLAASASMSFRQPSGLAWITRPLKRARRLTRKARN